MDLIQRHTELSSQIVHFCRYLRSKGLRVGPGKSAEALRALDVVPLDQRESFRLALRTVLTHSPEEQRRFDDLYQDYWRNLERAIDSKVKQGPPEESQGQTPQQEPKPQQAPPLLSIQNWLDGNQSDEEESMAAYSSRQVITQQDFSAFGEEELQEVMALIQRMARTLALRFQRRYESARRGTRPDIRRVLRHNLRQGGEMLDLFYKRRKVRSFDLVMLCDVSKSMDLYSRFLVQFIYAFQQQYRSIETFVFATSLHRITEQMRARSYGEALGSLRGVVNDWSGGTRIGQCLDTFVREHGRSLLGPRSLVLILSDGWDTGEVELLQQRMAEIHRRSAGVIWLNPLAGSAAFRPEVKAMEAAMPYIDVFAPAHSVDSLRQVVKALENFRRKPPVINALAL